MKLVVKPA